MNIKIIKSFINYKTYLLAVLIICVVTSVLLSSFFLFSDYINSYSTYTNEKNYGTFDIVMENAGSDTIQKTEKQYHNKILDKSEYHIAYETTDNFNYYVVSCDDSFFKLSPFELKQGRLPASENEIACEDQLLYQKGIVSDKMIGTELSLKNKKYTVTGIVKENQIIIDDTQIFYVFKKGTEKANSLYLDTDNNTDVYNSISKEYKNKSDIYVGQNQNMIMMADNADHLSDVIILIISLVIMIASLISVWNCIYVFGLKSRGTISIYNMIGLRKSKILIPFTLLIAITILISNIIGYFLTTGTSQLLIQALNSLYSNKGNDFLYTPPYAQIILVILIVYILEVIISISVSVKLYKMESYEASANTYNLKDRKVMGKPTKHPFLRIAFNNFSLSMKRNVFAIISIVLISSAMITVYYALNLISPKVTELEGIYYSLSFSEENYSDIEKNKEIIDKIKNRFNTYSVVSYSTSMKIGKEYLSREYKGLLSSNSEYASELNNKLIKNISIPMDIVLSNDVITDKHSVPKDNEILLINDLLNSDIQKIYGDNINDCKSIYIMDHSSGNNIKLTVSGVVDSADIRHYENAALAVAIVNEKTFNSLSNDQIPSTIYITDDIPEDEITSIIKGYPSVRLTNINNEIRNNKKIQNNISMIKNILLILFIICVISVSINISMTIIIRNIFFFKEYACLRLIGIRMKYIIRVLLYEAMGIFIPVITLVSLLSGILTLIIHNSIVTSSNFNYNLPFTELMICCVFIMLCLLLSIAPIVFIFKSKTAFGSVNE